MQPALGNATDARNSQSASTYGNPLAPPLAARDPSALYPWDFNEDDDMLGVVGDDELLYRLRFNQDRGAILDGDDQILGGGEPPPPPPHDEELLPVDPQAMDCQNSTGMSKFKIKLMIPSVCWPVDDAVNPLNDYITRVVCLEDEVLPLSFSALS